MNVLIETGNVRENVSGLVVLTGSKSWLSKAIKWFTRSKFSHAQILLGRLHGYIFKFEAQERGVIPYLFTPGKNDKVQIWETLPVKNSDEAIADILPLCGKRYWFENLLGFAITKPAGWLGIKLKNPFDGGWWCSKLAQHYVNKVVGTELYDPDDCTPEDMAKIFKERPELFKMVAFSEIGQSELVWH